MADAALKFEAGHSQGGGGIAFAKHGGGVCLVTCGFDGLVAVRDPLTAAVQKSHAAGGPDNSSPLMCLAASPAGGQVATGGKDQIVKVHTWAASLLWRLCTASGPLWSALCYSTYADEWHLCPCIFTGTQGAGQRV
jgi:WD40 repeat protein